MRARTALIGGLALLAAAQAVAWLGAPRREGESLPPGEFAGTLMLGGFRGVACDLLWMRSMSAKDEGRFYESVALADAITRVQPRFVEVWSHLAHDLAYNIAFEADGEDTRWSWFLAGVRANVRGVERNPGSERLLRNLAWMFLHKGDQFQARVEAADWAPLLNPVLAAVRADVGGDPRIVDLPAGSGTSNFIIAQHLYAACIALGEHGGSAERLPAFVRRMAVHALDADGNRLFNRGEHLAALRRWLDAGEGWAGLMAWAAQPTTDFYERIAHDSTTEVGERSEGVLRRRAALLAPLLAPDAASGGAVAAAILARRWDEARTLLARPGWKDSIGTAGRIRWLDE